MTAAAKILLDEHVSRIFERVLKEQGYQVEQAKDRFGECTVDAELLQWCGVNDYLLITNNAKDFESLHHQEEHAGLLLFFDHSLPDTDPEGLARTVDEVITQYGSDELTNELIDLEEWYNWLHD
ncbi:DUF5615 family PIN-like protein [Haladaptatus sp. NG-WS-4]